MHLANTVFLETATRITNSLSTEDAKWLLTTPPNENWPTTNTIAGSLDFVLRGRKSPLAHGFLIKHHLGSFPFVPLSPPAWWEHIISTTQKHVSYFYITIYYVLARAL